MRGPPRWNCASCVVVSKLNQDYLDLNDHFYNKVVAGEEFLP
jgi:hypothetical protein